jgi:hypothetical protein
MLELEEQKARIENEILAAQENFEETTLKCEAELKLRESALTVSGIPLISMQNTKHSVAL